MSDPDIVLRILAKHTKTGLSFQPSNELRHLKQKDAMHELDFNVKGISIWSTGLSGWGKLIPDATHEFVVLHLGVESERVQRNYIRRNKVYKAHDYIVLDFSGVSDWKNYGLNGALSFFSVQFEVESRQMFHEQVRRNIGKRSKCLMDSGPLQVNWTVRDIVSMALALTIDGYDVLTSNCRHFARSLFYTVSRNEIVFADDPFNIKLRRFAQRHLQGLMRGSASCGTSSRSASNNLNRFLSLFSLPPGVMHALAVVLTRKLRIDRL